MDLVSVIIPYYKKRNFVKETIVSVTNQSYDYLEILIIDKVLTVKSNSSITLDISNIHKQDKYNESDMQHLQEIVNKIKSESTNIKVKTS